MAPRKRKPVAPAPPESTDLTVQAQVGIRQRASRLREVALGATGISILSLLAVSSLLPFMTGPATVATVTTWLAGLGSNALAGWLVSWADKAGARVVSVDTNEALLKDLAADLDRRMLVDQALADSVAVLLDHIQAIPTILESRLEDQAIVLQVLRADLRRGDQIQGRLYRLLYESLEAQSRTILGVLAEGMAARSAEAQAVLVLVEQIRDELQQAPKPSINVMGSANLGTLQSGTGRVTGVEIGVLQGERVDIHGEQVTVVQYQPSAPIDSVAAAQQFAALPLDTIPDPASLPPGSRMPLARNPLFVGREADLKQLAVTLKAGSTAAIGQIAAATGLGGIGKTNLASEFVHRYGQYFAGGVFWLSFADAAAVSAEVAACGIGLDIPGFTDLKLDDQVARVRQVWQQPIPRLLVFDNCEDEALLGEWRPTSGGCRVLVTSRRARWDVALGIKILALDVLPRSESIALLRQFRPDLPPGDGDLDAIAAELGDLPLALHLAGSYLQQYQVSMTPAAYLLELRASLPIRHESLQGEQPRPSPTNHERSVERTFRLSVECLRPDSAIDALAMRLLARAAYFAPGEPIPCELLVKTLEDRSDSQLSGWRRLWAWVRRQSELDTQVPVSPRQIDDALARLCNLGLLEEAAAGSLRLHRLLVVFVQALAQDRDALVAVEQGIYQEANRLNKEGLPGPLLVLQGHLRTVTDRAIVRDDQRAARLCSALGSYLRMIGEYHSALPYLEQALVIRWKVLGKQHPLTAASLNNLGGLLKEVGNLSAARSYYEQALVISKKVLGEKHPDTARSLNNLGGLLRDIGTLSAARACYEQALAIYEQVLGGKHPLTAASLNNLGMLLRDMGDLNGARVYLEQALAINKKVLGEHHPGTATSLNNLGSLLQDAGDLSAARPYLEQALAIRRKVLGEQHPLTASSLNNLGLLLYSLGDLSAARPYLEHALAIFERVLGPDHPNTQKVRRNLASLDASVQTDA